MPVIDFPSNPSNNELIIVQGKAMRYNSDKNKWRHVTTMTSNQITELEGKTIGISSMSISGNTLVIQKDDSTHANVSLSAFAGNILTNYASASQLPTAGLVAGSQVYVTDTDSLFITDGSGWYKIATVNLSPSLSLGVSSISLESGGSVDINYTVNEPEDTPFTVTASATSSASITVHQANNTITFDSPVVATTETITITASDGINTIGDTLTMTISLGPDLTTLSQEAKIRPINGNNQHDQFGDQVDISQDGNYVIVGARGAAGGGAAYIFAKNGASYTQQIRDNHNLSASLYGYSTAIDADGDTAVIGSPSYPSNTNRGAAVILVRNGSTWTEQATISNPNANNNEYGGWSSGISDDGNTVVYGAYARSKAYIATRSGTTWSAPTEIAPFNVDGFAHTIAISGDASYFVVGAPADNWDSYAFNTGRVYVYTWDGTTATQQAILQASDVESGMHFGSSISIDQDGSTIAVGSKGGTLNTHSQQGAVYIFTRSGTSWTQAQKVISPNPSNNAYFGTRVGNGDGQVDLSSDGQILAVGAWGSDGTGGAGYAFKRDGNTFTHQKRIEANDIASNDRNGWAIAVAGDTGTFLLGSPQDDDGGTNSGSVYTFTVS